MKRLIRYIILLMSVYSISFATDIYHLIDPENLYGTDYRYGKTVDDGPPFFKFGDTQYYYHFNHSRYNSYSTEVANVFSQWNSVGTVQFSYSLLFGLPLKANTTPGTYAGGMDYGFDGKIIKPYQGEVILNSNFDWFTDGTQDLDNQDLDVETILLHEIGHIHGLAHPCTTDYLHNETAPIMAGSDNDLFKTDTARVLRQDDIYGTQFLQYNTWVPEQCSTLDDACDNSFSGTTIHIEDACSLTVNNTINSNITVKLESGSILYMNNKKITFNSGSVLDINGQTISPYVCLKSGTTVKVLYPNLSDALAGASTGETIEIGSYSLTDNRTIPSGVTLKLGSGSTLTMNNKKVTFESGSSLDINGQTISPYVCIKNGSTVKALYPSFAEAFSEVNSGETIEIGDNITLANTITIPDGVTIKLISNASIQLANCYLFFGAGAEITPNISLNSSSTSYVYGYHSALNDALDYCTTGKTVEVSGEYTSTVDINVDEDETLKPQSGSELKFAPEKYLYINSGGNLTASGATFTHTSGFWGGIKYQSGSSGSLYYCDINNASDGVHITNANPTIQNNIIENCEDYGLYVYNASPTINSNSIIDSRVYFNACLSTLNNNYITGATSVENPPICSIYMYNSSQTFWYNTIDIEDEFSIVTYNSTLEFGLTGEDPPECGGYNVLENASGGDGIIHATNYSDIYLGIGDEEDLYDYGYNAILGDNCPLWTDGTSYIDAQWCYWEDGDPAPSCYGNVETDYELDEELNDPGSSLAKSISSSEAVTENQSTYEDSLFSGALQMIRDKEYGLALTTFEQIIIDYEDSKYAYRAINLSLKLCRNQQVADTEEWLDKISKSINNDDLAGMIDLKKVSNYQKKGKIDKAIALSEKIPTIRKNKKYEVASLFNLFNFYHKDKENLEMAKLYLDELKANYPDNDLTYIARMDMNEEITYNKLEKELSSEALSEEEEIIIPETFAFHPAYPNPFNPSTTFDYALPVQSDVECSIYDISGNLVNEYSFNQNAGTYSIVWNGSNVSSGIYLIRFTAEAEDGSESFVNYQKVTLLK